MNIFTKITAIFLLAASLPVNAVLLGGKDWIQITDTVNYSWNDFDAIFDTTTGNCDVAGCLLGGSIDLTNYVWADNTEVNAMLMAEIGGPGLSSLNTRNAWVTDSPTALDSIFAVLNETNPSQIRGWTRSASAGPSYGEYLALIDYPAGGGQNDRVHLEVAQTSSSSPSPYIGGWVYRASVPEPSTIALFGVSLATLGFVRRRRFKS